MRRAICCTWLSSLLLLVMAGCWPGPADGTATPPLPTATPPAAATAAPISSTPVATATLPAVALPEVETAVSTQPPLPLALRWRRAAAGGAAAVDLFSLDGGPLPDVLLGSGGGQVITLGLAQDVYWQTDLGQRVTQLFGADFDNDLIGDVVVGGDDSQVRVLEGGIERWAARTSGRVTALLRWPEAPPGPAIIAASGDGDLQALTRDGELLWQVSGALDAYVTQLLAADVNADGETDLLAVSAAGQVRAWTAAGDSLWTADLGGGARQAAAVDFNGDGAAELVAGTAGGDLVALTSTGGVLWRRPLGGPVLAVAAADVDGDGVPEVVAGGGTAVALVTAAGEVAWRAAPGVGSVWAVAAADVEDDGRVEVLAGGAAGAAVLDDGGGVRGRFATGAAVLAIRAADMDQAEDRPGLELLARTAEGLYLLATGGAGDAMADAPLGAPAAGQVALPAAGGWTLLALGDVDLSAEAADFAYAVTPLLAGLQPARQAADLTVANLETVLTLQGQPQATGGQRAPAALADQLQGIDLVFLANDHALDFGAAGLAATQAALAARGIAAVGAGANAAAAAAPALLTAGGETVAFLAFTDAAPEAWYATAERPGVARATADAVAAGVAQARTQAARVVVALHGGADGQRRPYRAQVALARAAIDAGADLVLGYGPDGALAGELYAGGAVAYGLGGLLRPGAALLLAPFAPGGMQPPLLVETAVSGAWPQLAADAPNGAARASALRAAETAAGLLLAGGRPLYELRVDLAYAQHTAAVSQTVTLANDSGDDWAEVVFHAAPAYWGFMTLEETAVWLDGAWETAVVERQGSMLRVQLPRLLPPGAALAVSFGYRLALPRLDPSGWGPEGNAGWGPELVQMGDWYPALVPYQDGAGWQSWEYWPVGDPVVSLPGDYDVRIRTAADVVVAAPGYAGEADGERQYRLDGARAFAFLASPNYVRFDGTAGGVPVAVYVTRGYAAVGPVVLETAVGALQLFGELYGPYPYGEFVMAQNGFLTAMEYSALVSLSGFAFDSYADTPDSLLVAIIAHEVAHQWWYGAVGNDQVSEPWLDESLAMISELLYYERFHPELTAWWWQFRVDRWEPAGAVDVSIYDFGSSERFVHNMYGQAAHFMADLRQAMGAAAFGSFLRDYYQQYAGELATGADFLGLAQAYTAVDLGPVRDAYFR